MVSRVSRLTTPPATRRASLARTALTLRTFAAVPRFTAFRRFSPPDSIDLVRLLACLPAWRSSEVTERRATNGAAEFLHYERSDVPHVGGAGGGAAVVHPEAFAMMKDAFNDLKTQAQRHSELVGAHVDELKYQQQQQQKSATEAHTQAVQALHSQVR